MGLLEWIGAHLLVPLVNLYRAILARPRPDIRIVELRSTGGGTYVDFWRTCRTTERSRRAQP